MAVIDPMVFPLDLFVAFQVSDVIAFSRHFIGMDSSLSAEPGNKAAGRIHTASIFNASLYESNVRSLVDIKRRGAPMGFGFSRLLLHLDDPILVIHEASGQPSDYTLLRLYPWASEKG